MAKASSTTAAPTSSESRAPYTTRLQTSRPTSSVPNQCVAPGAVSRAETSMRNGSSAISGASTPTTVVMASNARPTTVARRRTKRTSQRARRRTGSAGLGSASTLMAGRDEPRRGANRAVKWFSLISDPGIEDDVREIHREIDEHVNAGDADDDALDDGIVAPQHRRDDQAPQAGNVEDLLDDHRAGNQDRERDADDGHGRDHRVLERVLVDDGTLAQPLGPAGDDELLAQHVEHRRACDARDQGRLHDAQRERGQRERAQRAEPAVLQRRVAGDGKPPETDGEEQDQQQAQQEVGNRDTDQR